MQNDVDVGPYQHIRLWFYALVMNRLAFIAIWAIIKKTNKKNETFAVFFENK